MSRPLRFMHASLAEKATKMKSNRCSTLLIFVFLILMTIIWGCGPRARVELSQAKYNPSFSPADFSFYRGAQLNLVTVTNRADNTNMFHYYSPDRKVYYESTQLLSSYLWYCFRDALRHAGIGVYEDNAPRPDVADFQLTMVSMSDRCFDFRVDLTRAGFLLMQKDFQIKMDDTNTYDSAALQRNAYALIDKSVTAILNDPDFQRAFKK